MLKQFWKAYNKIRRHRITGDLGFGLLVGVLSCILLSEIGYTDPLFGMPEYVVYGAAIGLAAFFLSQAGDWMPSVDAPPQSDTEK